MTKIKIGKVTIDSEEESFNHYNKLSEKYDVLDETCSGYAIFEKGKTDGAAECILRYSGNMLISVAKIHGTVFDIDVNDYQRKKNWLKRWKQE